MLSRVPKTLLTSMVGTPMGAESMLVSMRVLLVFTTAEDPMASLTSMVRALLSMNPRIVLSTALVLLRTAGSLIGRAWLGVRPPQVARRPRRHGRGLVVGFA